MLNTKEFFGHSKVFGCFIYKRHSFIFLTRARFCDNSGSMVLVSGANQFQNKNLFFWDSGNTGKLQTNRIIFYFFQYTKLYRLRCRRFHREYIMCSIDDKMYSFVWIRLPVIRPYELSINNSSAFFPTPT